MSQGGASKIITDVPYVVQHVHPVGFLLKSIHLPKINDYSIKTMGRVKNTKLVIVRVKCSSFTEPRQQILYFQINYGYLLHKDVDCFTFVVYIDCGG